MAASSDGKGHLRHWAILVSDMNLLDLQVFLSRIRQFGANDNTVLGIMYELFREPNNKNNVNINTKFGMKSLKEEWPMFSMAYIGRTSMTHEQIKGEGIYFQNVFESYKLLMTASNSYYQ